MCMKEESNTESTKSVLINKMVLVKGDITENTVLYIAFLLKYSAFREQNGQQFFKS